VFAGLVLQQPDPGAAAALLLVALPLLADPLVCVLRRLADRQAVFQAHRLHLFQRLHQAGWSHPQVAGLLIAACTALALAWRVGSMPLLLILAAAELALGVWLDRRVALSFSEASHASRHTNP
jgi:UDP-N-acetylmuramyl pentapeptide phosphotransferase/UDP-N-acetylglucosamine-1-phosphate transferase